VDEPNGRDLIEALGAHPELELHALLVLRDGVTVLERYAEPYRPGDRPLVYSASNAFSATAVGLAIDEGRFALDDRIVDLLDAASDVDDRVAQITVHHLLSMSTGHTEDTIDAMTAGPAEGWVEAFLAIRPQQPVGSCHVYNNGASFLLGELVRRHTGTDLLDYLRPRVLEPLGIEATWDTDPAGRCLGWSGLHIDVRGLAAMGELLRCDGVWQGRRLLPEGWVARATAKQIVTVEPSPEWNLGYGYQVWMGREGFRLDGAYGQFAFVLPGRELVVAVQSAQSCTQVLIDLLWEHLRTLGDAGSGLAAVPIPADSGLGTTWTHAGAVALDATMVDDGEEVGPPADLAEVAAFRTGDGVTLDLVAEGHEVRLAVTPGQWRRQSLRLGGVEVPVALAAGADEAGTLHVRLVFTDTPHTLRLRLGTDGSAAQAWKVNPLQGPSLAAMLAH